MLEKIGTWIVKNRIGIAISCLGILLLSAIGIGKLSINYDFYSYLPQDINSVIGQKILQKDFGFSDNIYVVLSGKTVNETKEIIDRLNKMPDVAETFWYSDLEDVKIPEDFASKEARDQFLSGEDTLIQITLAPTGRKASQQAEAIKAELGVEARVVGDFLYNQEVERLSNSAKSSMLVIAVIAILLVLVLALTQPAYSILFLVSAGIAILINFGLTGFFRGQMSFMTSSIAAALQLAVTMDYAIFLLHRYEEEKKTLPSLEAMAKSIAKTSTAVLSSGLTTMAGFLALLFMSMKMGGDMGIVMAQGVFVGFVVTLTILPALILIIEKPLNALKHRNLFPNMEKLGNFVVRNKGIIALIFLVLAVPAFIGSNMQPVTYSFEEGIKFDENIQKDLDLVMEKFGGGHTVSVVLLGADENQRLEIEEKLSKVPHVKEIIGPLSTGSAYVPRSYVPKKVLAKLESEGKYLLTVTLNAPDKTELEKSFESIKAIEKEYNGNVLATGTDMIQYDIEKMGVSDNLKVNIATILGVFVIVWIALRKFRPSLVLIIGIEVAIWLNIAIQWFLNTPPTFYFGPVALGAIQLGATVDYSILIATRYFDELKEKSPEEAMKISIREGSPAIITSALTLFGACAAISATSQISMVKDLTMLLARGALISGAIVITAIPALLLIFKGKIRRKNA
jgi:predicted RND superfamily exporter protein